MKKYEIVPAENFEFNFKYEMLNTLKNDNIVKFIPIWEYPNLKKEINFYFFYTIIYTYKFELKL